MKGTLKKSLLVFMTLLLTLTVAAPALANEGSVKIDNSSVSLDSEKDLQTEVYLATGQGDVTIQARAFLTSVAAKIFGKVAKTIVTYSLDKAVVGLGGWLGGNADSQVVKVNYYQFNPNDYREWVCDSCVNASDMVLLLQRSLNSIGFNAGTEDGIWGPKTKAALKEFQKAAGITQDGEAGPATWKKLAHK